MNHALMDYNPEHEAFDREALSASNAEAPAIFTEIDEMELAASLLEARDEAELDRFLGKLIARAGRAAGQAINRPTTQVLAGALRAAANEALPLLRPVAGRVRGARVALGHPAQSAEEAGYYFGLELEGLSGEDQEFELARSFVRFAGDAARHAAHAARQVASPQGAVRKGVLQAARHHAPGLLRTLVRQDSAAPATPFASPPAGRWVRRGHTLVIDNC